MTGRALAGERKNVEERVQERSGGGSSYSSNDGGGGGTAGSTCNTCAVQCCRYSVHVGCSPFVELYCSNLNTHTARPSAPESANESLPSHARTPYSAGVKYIAGVAAALMQCRAARETSSSREEGYDICIEIETRDKSEREREKEREKENASSLYRDSRTPYLLYVGIKKKKAHARIIQVHGV